MDGDKDGYRFIPIELRFENKCRTLCQRTNAFSRKPIKDYLSGLSEFSFCYKYFLFVLRFDAHNCAPF